MCDPQQSVTEIINSPLPYLHSPNNVKNNFEHEYDCTLATISAVAICCYEPPAHSILYAVTNHVVTFTDAHVKLRGMRI
jgi:hypothetical protein